MVQNEAKSDPRRPQQAPKRAKKANPNRKTKKGPSQVDPKSILESPRGRLADFSVTPRGAFGHPKTTQNGTKNDPRGSRTRLGAILVAFGAPSWAKKGLKPFVLNGFVKIHVFYKDECPRAI